MAKTSYLLIPPGYEALLAKGFHPGDRFVFPRIVRSNRLLSFPRKLVLKQRSLLPIVNQYWKELDPGTQANWTAAGAEMNTTGRRLFIQDTCERIKEELGGLADSSLLHQSWVGILHIEAPATGLILEQSHPQSYWTQHKVKGKKAMYEPILVTEDFALPLELKINYKAYLESVGPNSHAQFYAQVRSLYQGRDIFTSCLIEMDLMTDWEQKTATLSAVLGLPISYSLFLDLSDVRGDLFIDDLSSFHSGQNWVRDPACRDIHVSFTRAFTQVPKHWAPVDLPDGADYDSIYVDD
jgi:hypothetical protein